MPFSLYYHPRLIAYRYHQAVQPSGSTAVYRWIRDLAIAVSRGAGKDRIMPAAWRVAAKQWLLKNRMIRIRKAGKVLTDFSSNLCHNMCV
jgi:hypothetical protein